MAITLVLIVHTLITIALVGVILLQRSEGGGLGIGGGTGGGLVSARGAADLMTRTTTGLATAFVLTSLLLAILYGQEGKTKKIDADAAAHRALPTAPAAPLAPLPTQQPANAPLGGGLGIPGLNPAAPATAPGATAQPAAPGQSPTPGTTSAPAPSAPLAR